MAELAHAGVKGMKWGVRKDDDDAPRPVNQKRVDAHRKRVRAVDSQVDSIESQMANLGKRTLKYRSLNKTLAEVKRDKESADADLKAIESGKRITPSQKKAIIGASIVAGSILAIYGAKKVSEMSSSGQLNSYKMQVEKMLSKSDSIFKKDSSLSGPMSPEDVLTKISKFANEGYQTAGGKMNCRRVTYAHELRRRGYDVTATTSMFGYGQNGSGLNNAMRPGERNINTRSSMSLFVSRGMSALTNGIASDKRTIPAETALLSFTHQPGKYSQNIRRQMLGELKDRFSGFPPGSRGEVVFGMGRFGHSLSWENFGGKTVLFDSQKGARYDLDDSSWTQFVTKWGTPIDAEMTRLDNVEFDMDFLSRWAKNR